MFRPVIPIDLFGDLIRSSRPGSKDDVLIQVADFFAGSVAQIYEGKAGKRRSLKPISEYCVI